MLANVFEPYQCAFLVFRLYRVIQTQVEENVNAFSPSGCGALEPLVEQHTHLISFSPPIFKTPKRSSWLNYFVPYS